MRSRARAVLIAFCAPLALACSTLTDPPLPGGSSQFSPPPIYAAWWAMTEACSGISGSLAAVQWYAAPVGAALVGGQNVTGYWSAASNRIVLTADVRLAGDMVRHEMLHALVRAPNHVRSQFLDRCAGVVSCDPACVADAGPAPRLDPAWRRLPPDSLELGLDVSPPQPASTVNSGYFTLTVTARHRGTDTVVVVLPRAADGGHSVSFSCDALGPGEQLSYDDRAWDTSVTVFAPGETKREIFDFSLIDPSVPLWPGRYTVRGGYGERWTPPQTVLVSQ